MSDLKYQTVEQLEQSKVKCEAYISSLTGKRNAQRIRLNWIEHYLYEKSPQELTMEQIEAELGHKVILK
jgi:hypothetical protein